MDIKVQIPFGQFLTLVKTLSPTKEILRKELEESKPVVNDTNDDGFIDFLLNGPVYTDEDIAIIEENRKSITAWRTKI